jgi:predicted ABC-type ATPase
VPKVVIIAGPNGAGKTTFASDYLRPRHNRLDFVNADEIAREVPSRNSSQGQIDIRAARLMLGRIGDLVAAHTDFMFETTIATRTYARKIPSWRRSGYTVSLIYLRLATVEASLARVRRRVEAGGHSVPESIVRRRFEKSVIYFEKIYKPLVDEWYIWDSLEGRFALAESWDQR